MAPKRKAAEAGEAKRKASAKSEIKEPAKRKAAAEPSARRHVRRKVAVKEKEELKVVQHPSHGTVSLKQPQKP